MRKCTFSCILISILLILCHVSDSKLSPQVEVVTIEEGVMNRALKWLESQRKDDYGWESSTARVLTAIAAGTDNWPSKKDFAARLSTKQLEIELLDSLLRNETDPISPGRLALYILSLNAICKNPSDFHGYDLVGTLGKHHSDEDYPGYPEAYGYGLSSLVTCLSNGHLRKHQIQHLIRIFNDASAEHTIDTKALALMAVECVRRHRYSHTLGEQIQKGLESLAKLQKPDGSFGNTHATAMAAQAFGVGGNGGYALLGFWNQTAVILALQSMQQSEGSFDRDIQTTTDVILAMSALLNGSGVLSVRRDRCKNLDDDHPFSPSRSLDTWNLYLNSTGRIVLQNNAEEKKPPPKVETNAIPKESIFHPGSSSSYGPPKYQDEVKVSEGVTSEVNRVPELTTVPIGDPTSPLHSDISTSEGPDIAVKYWLWIGNEPLEAIKHNITVHVPVNSTFFHLMLQAAQDSEPFEFSSTLWPNGHYIHTIAGTKEQPIGYHYWLLYRLPADPDPNNPPPTTYIAPGGVDELTVRDGEIYMFWFKKI